MIRGFFVPVSGVTVVLCTCDDWKKSHWDGIYRANTALLDPVFFIQTVFSWIHSVRQVTPKQMLPKRQIRQTQRGSIAQTAEQRRSFVLFQTLMDRNMFHFEILHSAAAFWSCQRTRIRMEGAPSDAMKLHPKLCGCLSLWHWIKISTHVMCNQRKSYSCHEGEHVMRDIIKESHDS